MNQDTSSQLTPRDRHLFGPGHKRILALDGGGVRGAVTIAFLERLEKVVEEIEGRPVLLGDWFDIIGGTSTGAIIAGALALGYRAADIRTLYEHLAPKVFRASRWRVVGIQSKFDSRMLMEELDAVIGSRELGSHDLRTGLCVITKRMDTGSPWMVMNNPRSIYWNTPADSAYTGNCHYPLKNLVRASTAAPHYFDPEMIPIAPGMPPGLFVDGGVSPHNCPALYLFWIASLPQYQLNWPLGPENLTIVSLGTGSFRYQIKFEDLPWVRSIGVAIHALSAQISDAQQLIQAIMSWYGETPTRWTINSELGDLGSTAPPGGMKPLYRFLRYDIRLEEDWLRQNMDLKLDRPTVLKYRQLDQPLNIPELYKLGVAAAERQIRREHLIPPR
jgi:hypothetical protein